MAGEVAKIGFGLDLSPFRKGINSASAIIKKTFANNGSIKKFGASISKIASTVRRRLGGAFKGISRTLGGMKGLAVAFVGALAIGKLAGIVKGIMAAGRAFADSAMILDNAVSASGRAFDTEKFSALTKDISAATATSITDLNLAAANFVGRGFGEEAATQLTILAANASKKTGKSVEQTGKLMADALNGSVDAAKRLGIEVKNTGNEYADKMALGDALLANFSNVGEGLKNPSEALSTTLENIKVQLSEQLLPIIDPMITNVINFLQEYAATDMPGHMAKLIEFVQSLWGAIRQVIDVVGGLFTTAQNGFAFVLSIGELVIKGLWNTFTVGIPSLIKYVMGMVLEGIQSTGLGAKLLSFLGIDGSLGANMVSEAKDGFAALGDSMKAPMENVKDSFGTYTDSIKDVAKGIISGEFDGITDTAERKIDELAKKGEERAKAASENVAGALEGANGRGLLSEKFKEEQRLKYIEEREKALEKLNAKMNAKDSANNGAQVSVKVVQKAPNRFKRTRARS